MRSITLCFTAERSLARSLRVYAASGHGRSEAGLRVADDCRCKNFQPGCGCLAFCHKKTGTAVAMCEKHMAENSACKTPGFACYGCALVPHSDHAEYYVCRA